MMLKFGWLLFVVGLLFTIGGAFYLASSDDALNILEPFYCEDGESLIRTSRYSPYENSTLINFFCEGQSGDARNVDLQFFLTILVLMVPLDLSIVMIILGSVKQANQKKKNTTGLVFGEGVTYKRQDDPMYVSGTVEDLRFDDMPEVKDLIKEAMKNATSVTSSQALTLKEKLEQLREAYNAGALTYDEYERNKERVLAEFAEE